MTPKEKARELVNKYSNVEIEYSYPIDVGDGYFDDDYNTKNLNTSEAKQCALIAVDDIINELNNMNIYEYTKAESCVGRFLFWQEVKQEIEKL